MKRVNQFLLVGLIAALSAACAALPAGAASPLYASNPFTSDLMRKVFPVLLIVLGVCLVAGIVCMILSKNKKK